jgi:hypothetical protein
MRALVVALVLCATPASAQLFAPGAAPYPSPPLGRHFLDQPVAQCVIATPVSVNAVMLTPCPTGPTGPTPPPVSVTPPIAAPPPEATPKVAEPTVIRIEVVPVAPDKPAPKAAPKAPAPKKVCPC